MIQYKKCGCYCKRWEPTCELFNPQTEECIYVRNPKKLCNDCLYTDDEIKKIKESGNNDSNPQAGRRPAYRCR